MAANSVGRSSFCKHYMYVHGREMERHLQQKLINRFWLSEVLNDELSKCALHFPHIPVLKGRATAVKERLTPTEAPAALPEGAGGEPAFLVNIPLARLPVSQGYGKVESLVKRLSEESFGQEAATSRQEAGVKLAAVIGINQIASIDAAINADFRAYIKRMPRLEGAPYRVLGFFWAPEWKEKVAWKAQKGAKEALAKKPALANLLFDRHAAFRIVKGFDLLRAQTIRHALEGNSQGLTLEVRSQIPFQWIRQTIKESPFTHEFAAHFSGREVGPLYYQVMDADFASLRIAGRGYFSYCEEVIQRTRVNEGYLPSVLTLGYQLTDDALPLSRLAVSCDMAVRIAMNLAIRGGAYFPEPGVAFLLSVGRGILHNLSKLSFMAAQGKMANVLESRRAIENGARAEVLDRSSLVFASPGIPTQMPGRMATPTSQKYPTLEAADLRKREVLVGLREISQVHFNPLDWAHNLYEGLPSGVKKGGGIFGKLSGALTKVFAPFDPIGLTHVYSKLHPVTYAQAFDAIFEMYEAHVEALLAGEREGNFTLRGRIKRITLSDALEPRRDFIQGQFSLLLSAKEELSKLKLSEEWQEKVVDAAYGSGRALFSTLREFQEG